MTTSSGIVFVFHMYYRMIRQIESIWKVRLLNIELFLGRISYEQEKGISEAGLFKATQTNNIVLCSLTVLFYGTIAVNVVRDFWSQRTDRTPCPSDGMHETESQNRTHHQCFPSVLACPDNMR